MNVPELKHILLVQDDPGDIELIMSCLAENNLVNRIVTVWEGQEALDYLKCHGKFADRTDGDPAVVLLDLKPPQIDGLEVLKQIKTDIKLKCLPVIVFTPAHENRDIEESYKLGASSYILKPIDLHQFSDVIKIIGDYWAIVTEPPRLDGCIAK